MKKVIKKIADDLKESTKEAHKTTKAVMKEATTFKNFGERREQIDERTTMLDPHKKAKKSN